MLGNYVLAATTGKSGFNPSTLILILIVVVAFYLLMIRPQQRRKQQAAQKTNTVAVGSTVRTTAGMYATVVAVDDDDVVLEVAPGVEVRYMKKAIMDVISSGEEPVEDADGFADDNTETDGFVDDDTVSHDGTVSGETATGATAIKAEPSVSDETAYEQATGSKQD